MDISIKLKHPRTGDRRTVVFNEAEIMAILNQGTDRIYEKLGDDICKCQPSGETNVIECGCIDYIEDFMII